MVDGITNFTINVSEEFCDLDIFRYGFKKSDNVILLSLYENAVVIDVNDI